MATALRIGSQSVYPAQGTDYGTITATPDDASADVWVRPPEWLPLAEIGSTEQKLIGLYEVENHTSNFLSVYCVGAYTVDWGDGTVENVATSTQRDHTYNFAALPSTIVIGGVTYSTLLPNGSKQVLVTITAQGGQNVTTISLGRKMTAETLGVHKNWLDIAVSSPQLNRLILGYDSGVTGYCLHTKLQRVTISPYTAALNNCSYLFAYCRALRRVTLPDMSLVTSCFAMFRLCSVLRTIPDMNTTYGVYRVTSTPTASTFKISKYEGGADLSFTNITSGILRKALPTVSEIVSETVTSSGSVINTVTAHNLLAGDLVVFQTLTGGTGLAAAQMQLGSMFDGCFALEKCPTLVSCASVNCPYMFQSCGRLKHLPPLNTSLCTSFIYMFCDCGALQYGPELDTRLGTSMHAMFANCRGLLSTPAYDGRACGTFSSMVSACRSLRSFGGIKNCTHSIYRVSATPTADTFRLSKYEGGPDINFTTNITAGTLRKITGTKSVVVSTSVTGDASNDTITVTSHNLTVGDYVLFRSLTGGSGLAAAATSFSNMLIGCEVLEAVPWFETAAGISAAYMFADCMRLRTIPHFNTSLMATCEMMFGNCYTLQTIPLLDTSGCLNFANMFVWCSALKYLPLLNTSAGTNFYQMLTACLVLKEIPAFDTGNGTDLRGMLQSCVAITSMPTFNTSKATLLASFVQNCSNLLVFPLIDTSKATQCQGMFSGCAVLKEIPALDFSNCIRFDNMFSSSGLAVTPVMDTTAGIYKVSATPTARTFKITKYNGGANLSISSPISAAVMRKLNLAGGTAGDTAVPGTGSGTGDTFTTTLDHNLTAGDSIIFVSYTGTPTEIMTAQTNFTNMFNGCYLRELPQIVTAAGLASGSSITLTLINTTAASHPSLYKAKVIGTRYSTSLANARLTRADLVEVFNGLGQANGTQTVTVTGNPGAASLSQAEKDIAINKGWTVTT